MRRDQGQHTLVADTQFSTEPFPVDCAMLRREAVRIHPVVDDPYPLGRDVMESLEIFGHGLRQRDQDLPVIGVLPRQQGAELARSRQQPVDSAFERAHPRRPQEQCPPGHRGPRAAVRVE